MSESALQKTIIDALRASSVWVIRTGVSNKRGRNGAASGEPGMPDLWTPWGWIEVKLPGEPLRPEQVEWHAKARRHDVNVGVATSAREAIDLVRGWQKAKAA